MRGVGRPAELRVRSDGVARARARAAANTAKRRLGPCERMRAAPNGAVGRAGRAGGARARNRNLGRTGRRCELSTRARIYKPCKCETLKSGLRARTRARARIGRARPNSSFLLLRPGARGEARSAASRNAGRSAPVRAQGKRGRGARIRRCARRERRGARGCARARDGGGGAGGGRKRGRRARHTLPVRRRGEGGEARAEARAFGRVGGVGAVRGRRVDGWALVLIRAAPAGGKGKGGGRRGGGWGRSGDEAERSRVTQLLQWAIRTSELHRSRCAEMKVGRCAAAAGGLRPSCAARRGRSV